jgi:hypothetical protein
MWLNFLGNWQRWNFAAMQRADRDEEQWRAIGLKDLR